MSNAKKKNEVRPQVARYPVFTSGVDAFMNVVEANLKGEILSSHDLERIRLPTGGNLNWSLPSIDGEVPAKTFEAVILHHQCNRAFWKTGIENGSKAPDCSSVDGDTGNGDPGGLCEECPHSKYGSDKGKSRRQACRQAKLIYLLCPESYLPTVLVLPPSSLKPFKKFVLRLSASNIAATGIVVSFGLEKTTNRSKIAYSLATFSVAATLNDEEKAVIDTYADRLRRQGSFDQRVFLASDFSGNGKTRGGLS